MNKSSKTKQQPLLEMEELQTRLDGHGAALTGNCEILQAQIAERTEQRKPLKKLKSTLRASWRQYVNRLSCLLPT